MRRSKPALRAFRITQTPVNQGQAHFSICRNNAETLMKAGLGDLSSSFSSLNSKYSGLITASARSARPGLTDAPIPYNGLPGQYIDQASGTNRMAWAQNEMALRNGDLRTIVQPNVQLAGLAAGFAVAEYMFLQNYSSSATIGLQDNAKLQF